jgi:outer membrane receptor protein involved in Fe transport
VHGIVNVLNPAPSDLPPVGLSLEAGSDDYLRGKLALSGDTGAGAAGLALHATHDGGWRDESGFDEQKLSNSFSRAAAGGDLMLRLNATNLEQQTAGFIVGEDTYQDPALARSNPDPEAFRNAHSLRASAHYGRPLAGNDRLDLRLVLRSSRMEFLQHFLLGQPLEQNGQESLGVLLSREFSPGDTGRLIAGFDGELASGFLLQHQDGPATGGSPAANAARPAGRQYDYEVMSSLLAAYAQWEQALGARLTLTAGLRFEWLEYDYDNRMIDGNTDENGVPCPPPGCLYTRPADRSDRFTNWGPRLGLSWRLDESGSLWASATRGFRPPEATELYRLQRGQQLVDLGSEQVDGFEFGFRQLGDALSLELAAFWMDKEDVILRDSMGFNVSGGRTRHRGIEYGFDWAIGGGWSLAAAGTRALHTYEFNGGIEQGEQVTRGDDVDTAPRDLHSLRLRHAGERLEAELEWLQVGPYWADAANTAHYPGHDLLNLRLAFALAGNLSTTLRITNLADAAYADRADYAFGSYRYFPGRGRAAFLELGWRSD